MEIKKAPIDIKKFLVLSAGFESIPVPPDRKEKQLPPPPLDFDFNLFTVPDNDRILRIVVRILGNKEKNLPGYSFHIVAEGVFEFATDTAKEDAVRSNALMLALPILLHSVRGYLLNLTAVAPFGAFPLPMPDIKDLLEKKRLADLAQKGKGSEA